MAEERDETVVQNFFVYLRMLAGADSSGSTASSLAKDLDLVLLPWGSCERSSSAKMTGMIIELAKKLQASLEDGSVIELPTRATHHVARVLPQVRAARHTHLQRRIVRVLARDELERRQVGQVFNLVQAQICVPVVPFANASTADLPDLSARGSLAETLQRPSMGELLPLLHRARLVRA